MVRLVGDTEHAGARSCGLHGLNTEHREPKIVKQYKPHCLIKRFYHDTYLNNSSILLGFNLPVPVFKFIELLTSNSEHLMLLVHTRGKLILNIYRGSLLDIISRGERTPSLPRAHRLLFYNARFIFILNIHMKNNRATPYTLRVGVKTCYTN